jgi:hypothetical protein
MSTNDSVAKSKLESTQTVISFLRWYKANYEKIIQNQNILVNNAGSDDTTKTYSVNFSETDNYLILFKSSGYVSDFFLDDWRKYFAECEEYFKNNPQIDGPPDGFNFDLILLTQEVEEILKAIDHLKVIEEEENDSAALVKVDIMMRFSFRLSKVNNKWLIDKIDNLGWE